ncbi:MAG: hypothetical protein KF817_05145 [Phycisphaeraceae bacterium]|nr:hypothetical protein [Phycisphaeraceae bacterium]
MLDGIQSHAPPEHDHLIIFATFAPWRENWSGHSRRHRNGVFNRGAISHRRAPSDRVDKEGDQLTPISDVHPLDM